MTFQPLPARLTYLTIKIGIGVIAVVFQLEVLEYLAGMDPIECNEFDSG